MVPLPNGLFDIVNKLHKVGRELYIRFGNSSSNNTKHHNTTTNTTTNTVVFPLSSWKWCYSNPILALLISTSTWGETIDIWTNYVMNTESQTSSSSSSSNNNNNNNDNNNSNGNKQQQQRQFGSIYNSNNSNCKNYNRAFKLLEWDKGTILSSNILKYIIYMIIFQCLIQAVVGCILITYHMNYEQVMYTYN